MDHPIGAFRKRGVLKEVDGIPLARKLRTAFSTLEERGPAAAWSLLTEKATAAARTLPGGLVRVGACAFRPSDEPTRRLLLRGEYEAPERIATKRYIRRDIPVVELGASLGVVSCLVNRRLRNRKNHVVVEANPALLPILAENRDRNRCEFDIVHGAAGAEGSTIRFYMGSDALNSSSLARTERSVEVPVISVAEIVKLRGFERCALVCDIEGAELNLLRAELATLQGHVEMFIVEFHPAINGQDSLEAACLLLRKHGFHKMWQQRDTLVFRNTALV